MRLTTACSAAGAGERSPQVLCAGDHVEEGEAPHLPVEEGEPQALRQPVDSSAPAEPEPEPDTDDTHDDTVKLADPLPSAAEFCGEGTGLSLGGIKHCIARFGLVEDVTTSDVCHAHIKPATVPPGWTDEPELLCVDDEGSDIFARCWYKHVYRKLGTETQSTPPPGTRSMCAALAADPATARFVGKPSHFLSHAWLYKILNVVGALEEFEASQPKGGPEIFWWFDCFAIDEHATHALSQDWWGTTFKEAISMMGHTVMLLSPWDAPQPLTRAWCLWELHCTVETGSRFSICLGPAEKAAFRTSLGRDYGSAAIAALSSIDVRNSQAGDPLDLEMILNAVDATEGGAEALTKRAVEQLREKFVGGRHVAGWPSSGQTARWRPRRL